MSDGDRTTVLRRVSTDPDEPARDRVLDEVAGVIALMGAVIVTLALGSFSTDRTNLIGPVGSFFADSVLFLFGLAGFVFSGLLGAWGIALLRGRRMFGQFREVAGYLLLLACLPPVLHLSIDTPVLGHTPGGMLGGVAGELLVVAVGGVGAALCCATAALVALILITQRSFAEAVSWAAARARRVLRPPARAIAEDRSATLDDEDDDALSEAWQLEASGPAELRTDAGRNGVLSRFGGWFRARRAARNARAWDPAAAESGPVFELPAGRLAQVSPSDSRGDGPRWASEPAWAGEPAWTLGPDDDADGLDEASDAMPAVEIRQPEPRVRAARTSPPPAPQVPAFDEDDDDDEMVRAMPIVDMDADYDDDEPVGRPPAPSPRGRGHSDLGPVIVESAAQRQRKRAEDLDRAQQVALPLDGSRRAWQLPPLSYLNYDDSQATEIDRSKLRDLAARLERVLAQFKVPGRVSGICPGPVVTLFEFEPEPGIKLSRISGLSDDIAMALRAHKVRIIAPIPGKGCVGIEVPNESRETVYLKEVLADDSFTKAKSKLTLALGKDIEGFPVVMNLAKSPHLLVAGTTGSGKSVSVNSMITSLLYNASPDEVKLILIDPKQLEFGIYEGTPHLLLPVVTDPAKAATALNWAVQEMERRYKLMAELKVRNIAGYNERLKMMHEEVAPIDLDSDDYVPSPTEALLTRTDPDGRVSHRQMFYLVVVVDEFADLMMVAGKEVEVAVARLAQKARASGIHVILATQRPSVDVITGLIKANFPTRISFQLMSGTDSRTVLDTIGAENLLGQGDMLYRPPGSSELKRVHGALVEDREIEQIVSYLNAQRRPEYDESILATADPDGGDGGSDEPVDELYDEAVAAVIEAGFASISMVQRKLRIGYNRSARIIDEMERQGVIGPTTGGSSRRDVLVGGAHAHYGM